MRHVHPVLRHDAIRWLGRAISLIGLLALLALPLAGTGSGAPFHRQLAGFGKLEKALPAELRTGRTTIASTDKVPGGPAPPPDPAPVTPPPNRTSGNLLAWPPVGPGTLRAPFLRPAAQAPPVAI